MSRQSETGCLIWFGLGIILLLNKIIEEYPIIIVYSVLCISCLILLFFLLDYLHTLYFINFDKSLRKILNFDITNIETKIKDVKIKKNIEYFNVDKVYKDFIKDLENIKNQ